jgi:hypothetical protein
MGKSMDRQKNFRCLVLGVVSLASTREAPGPEATQRNEGGTLGEALQLRCNFNVWHCTPWPASTLSRSSASKTGRLGHTSRIICASRDWASPCAGVEQRRVEAWNFPDNGGETIVAWSLAPNLVMVDQHCIPPAHHESIIRPSLRFCFNHFWAATTARRRWGATSKPFPDDDDAPPRRSCRPRTRTLRFRPRIASSLVSDIPLSTELRRGKFQMPAKLHPGVEVHGDAKTATGSERHDSGSRISMNP